MFVSCRFCLTSSFVIFPSGYHDWNEQTLIASKNRRTHTSHTKIRARASYKNANQTNTGPESNFKASMLQQLALLSCMQYYFALQWIPRRLVGSVFCLLFCPRHKTIGTVGGVNSATFTTLEVHMSSVDDSAPFTPPSPPPNFNVGATHLFVPCVTSRCSGRQL